MALSGAIKDETHNITRLETTRLVINGEFGESIPIRNDAVLGDEIRRLDGLRHEFQIDQGDNYKKLKDHLEDRVHKAETAYSYPEVAAKKGDPPFEDYPLKIRDAVTRLTGFDKNFVKNWSAATYCQINDTIRRLESLTQEQRPATLEDYDQLIGHTLLAQTNPIIQDLIAKARREP